MKFTCSRAALAAAFKTLGPVRDHNPVKKILTGVLFEATASPAGGQVSATATDGGVYCRVDLDGCQVRRSGSCVIGAPDKLARVLAETNEETVDLELFGGDTIRLDCQAGNFRFDAKDSVEFPTLDDIEQVDCGVRMSDLVGALDSVLPASGSSAAKPEEGVGNVATNALTIELGSRGLRLSASNLARGAVTHVDCTSVLPAAKTVVPFAIPSRSARLIRAIAATAIEQQWTHGDLGFGEGRVHFSVARTVLVAVHHGWRPLQLVDKPKKFAALTVNRDSLLRAARSLQWARDDYGRVRLTARPGRLILSAKSPAGRGEVEVAADGRAEIDGLAVKCSDLATVLAAADVETVEVGPRMCQEGFSCPCLDHGEWHHTPAWPAFSVGSSMGIDADRTFYTLNLIEGGT